MNADYSLVIIGAGLQGVCLYVNLPNTLRQRCLVIDDHDASLENFYMQASHVGMKYLRSPASHCLREPLISLLSYAQEQHMMDQFQGRYYTPSLHLLKQYLAALLDASEIQAHYRQARMNALHHTGTVWKIESDKGTLSAERVILALGMGEISLPESIDLTWPESADSDSHGSVSRAQEMLQKHVLHPQFCYPHQTCKNIAVIGGGMSGTQLALSLLEKAERQNNALHLTIISGHPTQVNFFDSDPGYIGPKRRYSFLQETSYQKRAEIISQARNPGSINPYVHKKLVQIQEKGAITLATKRVVQISMPQQDRYVLHYNDGDTNTFDDIVFATGFPRKTAPHQFLVQALSKTYGLPTYNDAWPITDKTLCWHRGLYLTGALAEMELGPPARNIIGAHLCYRIFRRFWETWA